MTIASADSGVASATREQILHIAKLARDNHSLYESLPVEWQKRVELAHAQGRTDFIKSSFSMMYPETGPLRRALYPRHCGFFAAGYWARERAVIAANQTGKSVGCGAYETVCHATGRYPPWWKGRRFDHPVDIWCVGKAWGTVKTIINKELFGRIKVGRKGRNEIVGDGMIPNDLIVQESASYNAQVGQLVSSVSIRHVTSTRKNPKYSTIELKSGEQGRRAFEGAKVHAIWCDEEIPADVYAECLMRTITTNGMIYITFTPLDGITDVVKAFIPEARDAVSAKGSRWTIHEGFPSLVEQDEERKRLEREDPRPDLPGVRWLTPSKAHISIAWKHGIPHLSQKAMAEIMESTPHYQRKARREGKPVLGIGQIYPFDWSDVDYNPKPIPPSWPQCIAVDPGYQVTAAVAMAWDRETDTVYVWGAYYRPTAVTQVNVASLKEMFPWQPGVVDPAAGTRNQTDGQRVIDLYRDAGMVLMPADNAVDAGIQKVRDRLASGRLKFATHLDKIEFELGIYRWDEKGKVVKEDDHLMDAIRYGVMSGLQVAKTRAQMESRHRPPAGFWQSQGGSSVRVADSVAGY